MSLRTRALTIIGAVFSVLIIVVLLTSRHVILTGYNRLETEYIEKNVQQVTSELSNTADRLLAVAGDWAHWDETYEFIQNQSPTFLSDNLTVPALTNLKVNFMLFADSSRHLKYAKSIDLQTNREKPLPADFWDRYISKSNLTKISSAPKGRSGVLMAGEMPVVVAAMCVLKSDLKGPANGLLVIGKLLNPAEINRISEVTGLFVTITPYDQAKSLPEFENVLSRLKEPTAIAVIPSSKTSIAGYVVQQDPDGRPAVLIKISADRKIYAQGLKTFWYFAGLIVGLGLIFISMAMLLLEKTVLTPLVQLNKNVARLGTKVEPDRRLSISSRDELGNLEHAINNMLDRIEDAQKTIHTLEGFIPICSYCKSIRDDGGFWQRVEAYVQDRTEAKFSHGVCPDCVKKHYPELKRST